MQVTRNAINAPGRSDQKSKKLHYFVVLLGLLGLFGVAFNFGRDDWSKQTFSSSLRSQPCPPTTSLPTTAKAASLSLEQRLRGEDQQVQCEWLPRRVDSGLWFSNVQPDAQPDFTLLSAWMKPEYPSGIPAAEDIPELYQDGFTMNGKVELQKSHYDQAYLGGNANVNKWTKELVQGNMEKAKNRVIMKYEDGLKIHDAMERYNAQIAGKNGIVVGSEDPWVEAVLLHHGAGKLLTVEFGKIESEHPQIETMLAAEFTEGFLNGKVEQLDFGISYSSLEHDGLGRYGDILNPIGDLQSMAKMLSVIKPGGLFFIGVPTAERDVLVFNAHRIYGTLRLPKLLAGWKLIDIIHNNRMGGLAQHVIVLQNKNGCDNPE